MRKNGIPNSLTLLEETKYRDSRGAKLGIYMCDCGVPKVFPISDVNGNFIKSCGCKKKSEHILIGHKYGNLTIIKEVPKRKYKFNDTFKYHRCFLVKCDCGVQLEVLLSVLKSGNTKSCGCIKKETTRRRFQTHGLTNHPLYKRWKSILSRCFNEKTPSFCNYGGRGISMCDEWKNDFISFYNWSISNGFKSELQLDRINNDGNYEPSNCRWVSAKINSWNRRSNIHIEYNGTLMTISELSEIYKIEYSKLYSRIVYYKMPIEKAIINKNYNRYEK